LSAHLLSCSIKYFSPCPLGDLLKKTFHACMGSSYLSSLSLKQHIRMKHVRSANWVAPKTCPRDVSFLSVLFEAVSQLHGINMPPRDVSYLFEGVGTWFPIKFPNRWAQGSMKVSGETRERLKSEC
jgi:hypothetical protein